MATEFKLPELGENIEAGDVVRVAVTAGETIKEGQTVIELETDKAVIEVPSTVSGVIEEVSVAPSQRVKAGDVLFTYTAAEAGQARGGRDSEGGERTGEEGVSQEPRCRSFGAAAANAASAEFKLPELGENIESGDVVRVTVATRRGSVPRARRCWSWRPTRRWWRFLRR